MKKLINIPLSSAQFLSEVVERDMYIARSAVSPSLVNWDDFNTALYCMEAGAPHIRLHKEGLVPEENYTEHHSIVGVSAKRLNQQALGKYMQGGATLVLNRIDSKSEIIRQLCDEISEFSQSETIANGYVAFSGHGSFGNHWDTHDVMAVQLIGRKHWKVYKPTFELPISGQTSKKHKHDFVGEPVFDGILEAGDLMYLPRGWWHNALPIGETFHVAIGMHNATVLNFLQWLCQGELKERIQLRQSIRPSRENVTSVNDAIDIVKSAMASRHLLDAFIDAVQAQTHHGYRPFSIESFDPNLRKAVL